MEHNSYLLEEQLPVSVGASGPVGTAAATVDIVHHLGVTATAASLVLTLPAPTDGRDGWSAMITNAGTNPFEIYGVTLEPDEFTRFMWSGGVWHAPKALAIGEDPDWYGTQTSAAPASITDDIYTQGCIGVNGGANMDVKAPLHLGNNIAPMGGQADFNTASPADEPITDFKQFQELLWEGGTPETSHGRAIEAGMIVDHVAGPVNSSARGWGVRVGGRPQLFVRGDGYIRRFGYGDDLKNNGTPTHAILGDASHWGRERPITDGAPRVQQALYGGNWMWGGWSPVYTANTAGYVDEGWFTAFTATAPQVYAPYGTTRTMDMQISANFGQRYGYIRECVKREIYGWRVLVNGTVVGTRATAVVHYDDERTNLGDEVINKLLYQPIGDWHWTRNNVPPGAAIEIQYQVRRQVTGSQTNAYARFIAGVYREASISFLPARTILI